MRNVVALPQHQAHGFRIRSTRPNPAWTDKASNWTTGRPGQLCQPDSPRRLGLGRPGYWTHWPCVSTISSQFSIASAVPTRNSISACLSRKTSQSSSGGDVFLVVISTFQIKNSTNMPRNSFYKLPKFVPRPQKQRLVALSSAPPK